MSDSFVTPMVYSPPGSSVHGISQAKILEWVAISFSRGSSWPRDWTCTSCIGRKIIYHWVTQEARIWVGAFPDLFKWCYSVVNLWFRGLAKAWAPGLNNLDVTSHTLMCTQFNQGYCQNADCFRGPESLHFSQLPDHVNVPGPGSTHWVARIGKARIPCPSPGLGNF